MANDTNPQSLNGSTSRDPNVSQDNRRRSRENNRRQQMKRIHTCNLGRQSRSNMETIRGQQGATNPRCPQEPPRRHPRLYPRYKNNPRGLQSVPTSSSRNLNRKGNQTHENDSKSMHHRRKTTNTNTTPTNTTFIDIIPLKSTHIHINLSNTQLPTLHRTPTNTNLT